MSNKDLVSRARAMLKADDVDTKDMLAMVGELADAIQRVPCILANRCAALEDKPAAVKDSLTTAAVPDGYALVPVEPTAEMIAAGWFNGDMACAIGHALAYADSVRDYKAMLAAQQQKAGGAE